MNDFNLTAVLVEPYSQRINGTILNAIKKYESMGVPLNQLLSDYNDVMSGSNIRDAINPWEYINQCH